MAKILDFKANNTTAGTGALTNVIGPDWGVARNSVAYEDNGGLLTSVGVNVARVESGKILVEGQKTNLCSYSKELSNAIAWDGISSCVVTADQLAAPDGEVVADLITTNNTAAYLFGLFSVTPGTDYTVSSYMRTGNTCSPLMAIYDQINGAWIFNDALISPSTTEWNRNNHQFTTPAGCSDIRLYIFRNIDVASSTIYATFIQLELGDLSSYITTGASAETREADVITNTVPNGTAPITMTTWIDGVSDGGQVVNQGDPITMLNGTTSIEIDDSGATTTVEVEWVDSISVAATGNKIYRDDIEIADIANGVQFYSDTDAPVGTESKYEVQAHDGAGDETTREEEGKNMAYITTA